MSAVRDEQPPLRQPLRSIVVLRALHLGDLLCAVPTLRALRIAQPDAQISLIGLPWAAELLRRYPRYLDEVLTLPGGEALLAPDDARLADFLDAARRRRYDLALQLHGDGTRSRMLIDALGADRSAGFHPPTARAPDRWHLRWRAREPEVWRGLRLLRHLGGAAGDAALEFPLRAAERQAASELRAASGLKAPYVCLHVGAKLPSRRWPAAHYAVVAQHLLARGYSVALTGTADEAPLVAGVMQACADAEPASRPVDLCGRTDLGTVAAMIESAEALISNDTGVAHLAVALRTPSVVLSCGSEVARWAPLDRLRHRVLAHVPPCRPCMHAHCPHGHACATAIAPQQVMQAFEALPRRELRHAA